MTPRRGHTEEIQALSQDVANLKGGNSRNVDRLVGILATVLSGLASGGGVWWIQSSETVAVEQQKGAAVETYQEMLLQVTLSLQQEKQALANQLRACQAGREE